MHKYNLITNEIGGFVNGRMSFVPRPMTFAACLQTGVVNQVASCATKLTYVNNKFLSLLSLSVR
jgi:hypothetical protein